MNNMYVHPLIAIPLFSVSPHGKFTLYVYKVGIAAIIIAVLTLFLFLHNSHDFLLIVLFFISGKTICFFLSNKLS